MVEVDEQVLGLLDACGACSDALDFVEGCETTQEAWDTCEEIGWLLWLAMRAGLRKRLQVVAEECIAVYVARLNAMVEDYDQFADQVRLKSARQQCAAKSYSIAIMHARVPSRLLAGRPLTAEEEPCNILRKHIPEVPTVAEIQAHQNDPEYSGRV